MLKAFLFIVAVMMNDGHIEMRAVPVEACPQADKFSAGMDALQNLGKLKEWNAMCVKLPAQGQDT